MSEFTFSLFNKNLELKRLDDIDLSGRRVFVRTDFNVPLAREGKEINVSDDTRIRETLPTLRELINRGARLVLGSHLGRPKDKVDPLLSLEPVAVCLAALLDQDVLFSGDCDMDQTRHLVNGLKNREILLLENLRFSKEEKENSPKMCEQLSKFTDVFVNDAFGTLHRSHASTVGLPLLIREKGIGRLVEKELVSFSQALSAPDKPLVLILGGAKIKDKIPVLEQIIDLVDACCIGGALAYTFLAAAGKKVGNSPIERGFLSTASRLLRQCEEKGVLIYLPQDHIAAMNQGDKQEMEQVNSPNIPDSLAGFDIGPSTVDQWREVILSAGTIIWNGPLGLFEQERFSQGTLAIAKAVADSSAFSIVGGGDSLSAIKKSGVGDQISHLSTGGGAMLKLLSGSNLPALEVLTQ